MDPRNRESKPLLKPITWVYAAAIILTMIAAFSSPSMEEAPKAPKRAVNQTQLCTDTVTTTVRIYVVDHGNFVDETTVTTFKAK